MNMSMMKSPKNENKDQTETHYFHKIQHTTCSKSIRRQILCWHKKISSCSINKNIKPAKMLESWFYNSFCIFLLPNIPLKANSLHKTEKSIRLWSIQSTNFVIKLHNMPNYQIYIYIYIKVMNIALNKTTNWNRLVSPMNIVMDL